MASGRTLLESVKSRLSRGDKLKIVFDGFGSYADSSVIFSGKKTADEIIRQFIEENYNKNQITVVSSDMEVFRLAKACGCDAKKSEEFWKENIVIKKKIIKTTNSDESEKPSGISRKDFEEFKNLFK
jgi:predicted RNA-binding protein with PIN domain